VRVLRLALVLAFCPSLFAQAGGYLITTVVGNGTQGSSGDNGPATSAQLYLPYGVAVDPAGNLYIADYANNRIRRVTNRVITTVAGSGTQGFSGDNGLATSAQLYNPSGVAVDSAGSLYIADGGNQRIRKVSNGVITTVAGNGVCCGFSGDNGPATSAQLYDPTAVAVDSAGNLYIADAGNYRIRTVSNGVITTVAGTGVRGYSSDNGPATSAQLYGPAGVAVDSAGNLYINDGSNRIRKVSNGVITTVAGNPGPPGFSGDNGPATSAGLHNPGGIAVDSAGDLYIADYGNNRIRKVSNGVIATVAGNGTLGFSGDGGPATSAQLNGPTGVAVDTSGNVFIVEPSDARIRQLIPSSTAGCVYSIDQSAQSFVAAGGSGSVGVLASAAACPWLAASYAGWITVSPSSVASGTELVTYTVSPNPDSASRTGTIWIAGKGLTVNQSGVVCSLGAAPRSVSVAASGLTGASLTVTSSAPDCQWTAVASVPWILVGGGNTGMGSGTVTYTVGVNTGVLRTGTITVAGQQVSVNQAASGGSVSGAAFYVGGIVNAASSSPPIAPGSFVSIYGQSLSDTTADWSPAIVNGKLPTSVGGVQVLVNGKSAFISYVQPTQVNVLAPPDNAVGPVEVDVINNHGTAVAMGSMAGVSPALFTYALRGRFYADALFGTDYAYVAAVGALPGITSRPAQAGDYILLFATGLGQTNPPYPVGQVLTAAYPVPDLSKVSVSIGGQPALVQFAGMTYAGVFQVNIQVPNGIPAGDQPIVLGVAGQASPPTVYLTFGGG
jgi:uncharacterized protein (TIGR03437 family)